MDEKYVDGPEGRRPDYEDFELKDVPGIESIVHHKPVSFILGDNMQFLRWMKDNMKKHFYHVGIVDPPYGINVGNMNLGATKNTVRKYEMGDWDGAVPTQEYWDLLNYCCRDLIVWGGNYFTDRMGMVSKDPYERTVENICGIRPGRCFITWDKQNDKMSFADGELAITTFDRNAVIVRRPRNAKTEEETERRHPTQKPVYLYDYLNMEFVEKGQRVLDTHGGSHSHAIAAWKNGVSLTIIEKFKNYHEDGIKAYIEVSTKKGDRLF